MKMLSIAAFGILLLQSAAGAHDGGGWRGGLDGLGGYGLGFGLGWGGHEYHGAFGGGFGFDFFNVDHLQTRFEGRFDGLKMQYDEGVASGSDFFTSTEYDTILDRTERLSDRYDFFVTGVERGIDRLGDVISNANDDIAFYNDLLANYQADTSISASRLERIELWINRLTDRLTMKIDAWTETQTTLQTNLPSYQAFQTDLSTFFADIVAAGSGASDTTSASLASLANAATTLALAENPQLLASVASATLSANAVPEPFTATMLLMLIAAGGAARGCRRRA